MRKRGLIWGIVLLALGLWGGWSLASGRVTIDADVLSLIGQERTDGKDRAPIDAVRHLLRQDGRRAVFMVSSPSRTQTLAAANALADALAALPGTQSVDGPRDRQERLKALRAFFAPQAGTLLAEADRADLETGLGARVAERGLAALYAPTTPLDGDSLRRDPFSLHQRALLDMAARLGGGPDPVTLGGLVHTAVHVTLAPGPEANGGNGTWVLGAEAAMAGLTKDGGTIQRTGQIFFAWAEGTLARGDVQRIGLITGLGLLVLVVVVFASWTPIAATLLTVGSGLMAGLAAVTALYPALHAIALVFGASLIGISVDYAFHYLTQDPARGSPSERLDRIRAGLALGLATSIMGFLALAASPLALLGQIAAYSIAGLSAACLTVFLLLPLLPDRKSPSPLPLARWMDALSSAQKRISPGKRGRIILAALILVGFLPLGLLVQGQDDIRQLGSPHPDLLAQAKAITQTLGLGGTPLFVAVTGTDRQEVLRRSEEVRAALTPLITNGALAGVIGPSDLIPSKARQEADRALITKALILPHGGPLASLLGQALAAPIKAPFLTPDTEARAILPELDSLLEDRSGVLRIRGAESSSLPALTSALQKVEGATLVDPRGTISAQFASYRHWAGLALGLTMVGAALLAAWRHGPLDGGLCMAAPAGAVLFALAGGQLLGIPLTFFTTMSLFLVFSIGADYALFLAEARDATENRDTTLAVLLSLISSLLAFGLLATSAVPLVGSIGGTIALGLVSAWVLAPLLAPSHTASE